MRISAYNNLNTRNQYYYTNNKSVKNTSPQSFKAHEEVRKMVDWGTYSYDEVTLAEKYLYVKNPYNIIDKEISRFDRWCGDRPYKVMELIKMYRKYYSDRNKYLSDLVNDIDTRKKDIDKLDKKNKDLENKISRESILKANDKIKLSKIINSKKRLQKTFAQLDEKYIGLFCLKDKNFPDGIMIMGMDKKNEQNEVLNYLKSKNCEVVHINFDNISLDKVHKELYEHAQNISNSGKHKILYIENFYKYTTDKEENFNFINRLKGFLCRCSKDFNTTILIFESNPERLDENIIGGHRFQKRIDLKEFNDNNYSEFLQKYDGYTLVYDDKEESNIDLYLGSFGKNRYILWADASNPKQINAVLKRIDKIKELYEFKDVEYLQFPQLKNMKNLKKGYKKLDFVTSDYQPIYEYSLNTL